MKNNYRYITTRSLLLLMVATGMAFLLSSCGTTSHFEASSIVPAAEGVVKVKKDNNNNYKIDINIHNLAEPEKLQPARNTYVVWMEGEDNQTKNIGQIKSSHSILSKSLKGTFESVSAVKPRKIFITAEDNPGVQYPDNMNIVLTTNYLKD